MLSDNLNVILISLLTGCLPALAVLAAALRMRVTFGRRLQRLEDALRVYNSANAELGRQLRELEEGLRVPTPRTSASRVTGVSREVAPLRAAEASSAVPVSGRSEASRPAATTPFRRAAPRPAANTSEPEFSEAELRLARLLKSRLPALGVS